MIQARGSASGKTLRTVFSGSKLNVSNDDLERIVDTIVPKHIDAETAWLEFTGGLSRIYAPQSGMHLFKAVIDGTVEQARREAEIQRYIAGCTMWESEDGLPVVPEVYEHFVIPLEQHALEVLSAVSTTTLGGSEIELPDIMDEPAFQELCVVPTSLHVDGQTLNLSKYLKEIEDAVIPVTKMERLIGGDDLRNYLNERQKEGEIELKERLQLAKVVSDALSSFHKSGYIHRDLKPANIYIQELSEEQGGGFNARFVDCGSAVAVGEIPKEVAFIGTLRYASMEHIYAGFPHQKMREKATARVETDIFCLGEIIHKLIHGMSPVSMGLKDAKDQYIENQMDCGEVTNDGIYYAQFKRLMDELQTEAYLAPIEETLNKGGVDYLRTPLGIVDNIMYRALRKDPDRRYSDVQEISVDLQRAITTLEMYERNDIKKHVKTNQPILESGLFVIDGDDISRVDAPETPYEMFVKSSNGNVA